jgi:uncharacterized protein with PIN domain
MKTLVMRALSVIQFLSKRLRILFQRRQMFLVDDDSLERVLAQLDISSDELQSARCVSCGQPLTVNSIGAWMMTDDGIEFHCDSDECLVSLTEEGAK